MKAGWQVKPLGDLCEVLDSKRKPITKRNRVAGPYPYYGATGIMDHVDGYLFDEPLVLIGEDGAKWDAGDNSSFTVSGKVWVNNHAHTLRPDRVSLLDDWLVYYINYSDLSEFITGMTVPKLNQGRMREIHIPLPPLDEQKRIVAILDAAFDGLARARANVEANLQNARELFESFTREALSNVSCDCRIVELSDVAEITSGLVDPKEDQYQKLLHVGAGNMVTGSDLLENVQSARDEKLISGKHTFDRTMVLYSKIRPYLKKAARPMFDGLCSADVYPLKPIDGVLDRDFLFHLLLAPDFTEYAKSGSDRVGMPKVNRKHLFNFKFRLPSFDGQVQVAAKIDGVMKTTDTLVSSYQSKLANHDELRQSLLQKAFAGELT